VAAAGGDGTVSAVVNGLANQDIPLGIIPVGTGNGLARAMNIPLDLVEAIHLLAGEHELQPLDAMQVGDKYFILNVSAGISSRAMRETKSEDKRRLGMLAYAQTIVEDLKESKTSRFNLLLDGLQVQVEAAEVLVANGTVLKEGSYVFGSRRRYNDGEMEINILTASQPSEYVRLALDLLLNPKESIQDLHDLTARESVVLDVEGQPQPVQADGELIGRTPVEIKLARSAIRVVVPAEENA
jgi:diacylglycerol kinase family enzyme